MARMVLVIIGMCAVFASGCSTPKAEVQEKKRASGRRPLLQSAQPLSLSVLQEGGEFHYPNLPLELSSSTGKGTVHYTILQQAHGIGDFPALVSRKVLDDDWLVVNAQLGNYNRYYCAVYLYAHLPARKADPVPWKLVYATCVPDVAQGERVYIDRKRRALVFVDRTRATRLDIGPELDLVAEGKR